MLKFNGLNQLWKNRIKNSNHLGEWYLILATGLVKFLQIFVRVKDKQILFISYSGRQYSDSPKELYLKIKHNPLFIDYKLVWAFNDPDQFPEIPDENKVNATKITYFFHLLRSKYWVANSSIDKLLPFKHPNNIYIQFWHGIPLKHLGVDEKHLSKLVKNWYKKVSFDYFFTHGKYDGDIFKRVFPETKHFVEDGSLRFDMIKRQKPNLVNYRNKLGIDPQKKTILYVPTFREYKAGMATSFSEAYLEKLAKEYNVLFRGHYFKKKNVNVPISAVDKESLYKLYWVTDILVTDYSSAFFEFLPFHKSIYFFEPDLSEYKNRRGLYQTPEEMGLPVAHSEFEFDAILQNDKDDIDQIKKIEKEYLPSSMGSKTLNYILNEIILYS